MKLIGELSQFEAEKKLEDETNAATYDKVVERYINWR